MSIGERITTLRKEQNISQGQLADALGVTRQAVSKWENDLAAPDTIKLIQLADLLNTDVEYLTTGRHSILKAEPEIITVTKPVEVVVERVVEKPVLIEKIVEIEKPVEIFVEKPVIKKVYRTRLIRNPMEFIIIGSVCFIAGVLIGLLL